jgi:DNA-directed RNA polymerase subunit beta
LVVKQACVLREMLTVKSDDIVGRTRTFDAIIKGEEAPEPGIPASFNVLKNTLRGLALDVGILGGDKEGTDEYLKSEYLKNRGVDIDEQLGVDEEDMTDLHDAEEMEEDFKG